MCIPHLVFVEVPISQLLFTLLLKGDDDESNENVDKEKRKNDEENDVENGHFHPVAGQRPLTDLSGVHRMLQNAGPPFTCRTAIEVSQGGGEGD